MVKVIHGADFHLDAPFAALPPERAAQRRAEQRELLGRLADLANREGADLVLLAGDLFDSAQVYGETLEVLAETLGEIHARVLIAPGNHDFWSERSPYAQVKWPENVHVFSTSEVESVDIPQLDCVVHGAAFVAPGREDRVLENFQVPQDGRIHILLLHGDVAAESRYGPIPEEDMAHSGADYVALGHIHARTEVCRAGETAWAYSGCPEGRGFDELGEKGVFCGTVQKGEVQMNFIPLATRRYWIREIDVTGQEAERAFLAALPEQESPDFCRILLTGERGMESLDIRKLEEMAASRYYSVSVRDKTRVRRELWDRAGEDTLTGLFLQQMRRRLEEAEDEEARAAVELAVRFGLSALEHREDPR